MAKQIPSEIITRIIELRQEGHKLFDIQDSINEELGRLVSFGKIQSICKGIETQELTNLDDSVKEFTPCEIHNDHYIFYKEEIPYPISISTIDNIFKDYSKYGSNLSGQEIMSKYQLKPETWNLIKSRLQLYKESNIISPNSLSGMSEEESEDYIEHSVNETIQDKYKRTFEKKYKREKEAKFVKYSNYYHKWEGFLSSLEGVLENYEPIEFKKPSIKKENNDTIDVTFSDIHLGKKNTEDVLMRIYKMTHYLCNREETNINIIFLGDLVESLVTGGMHTDQERNMEYHGFDLILLVTKALEDMLLSLHDRGKKVVFYGIGGNHDRIGKKANEDEERTVALVIYEILRRGLINYDVDIITLNENINTIYLDNYNYIVMHGEKQDSIKAHSRPESFLWNHITKYRNRHTVILHGDKHNLDMNETKDATIVGVPALAGQGTYDKRLDLHSECGFIVIQEGCDYLPDLLIKRLA